MSDYYDVDKNNWAWDLEISDQICLDNKLNNIPIDKMDNIVVDDETKNNVLVDKEKNDNIFDNKLSLPFVLRNAITPDFFENHKNNFEDYADSSKSLVEKPIDDFTFAPVTSWLIPPIIESVECFKQDFTKKTFEFKIGTCSTTDKLENGLGMFVEEKKHDEEIEKKKKLEDARQKFIIQIEKSSKIEDWWKLIGVGIINRLEKIEDIEEAYLSVFYKSPISCDLIEKFSLSPNNVESLEEKDFNLRKNIVSIIAGKEGYLKSQSLLKHKEVAKASQTYSNIYFLLLDCSNSEINSFINMPVSICTDLSYIQKISLWRAHPVYPREKASMNSLHDFGKRKHRGISSKLYRKKRVSKKRKI